MSYILLKIVKWFGASCCLFLKIANNLISYLNSAQNVFWRVIIRSVLRAISTVKREIKVILLPVLAIALTACTSSLKEEYYLSAHDPLSNSTNYFRIKINGDSQLTKVKYSVGFYNRSAIEQLFGEKKLHREHLSTEINVFDQNTGKRLTDLSSQILAADRADNVNKKSHTEQALYSTVTLLGIYETKLKQRPDLLNTFQASLDLARKEIIAAQESLVDSTQIIKSITSLQRAHAILSTIRIAVDGDLMVRFFDGAGNELDVNSLSMVIFVANDSSQFTEAIRQLAEADEVTQDVLALTLGAKIQEARFLEKKVAVSNNEKKSLDVLMGDILESISASNSRTEIEGKLLVIATAVADQKISSNAELDGVIKARRFK